MSERRALRLVIEREVREALRRKVLWVAVALAFIGSTAIVVLPSLLGGSDDVYKVGVVGEAGQVFSRSVEASAKANDHKVKFIDTPSAAAARNAVRDGEIDAAIVVGARSTIIVRESTGSLVTALRGAVANERSFTELKAAGLTNRKIAGVLSPPEVTLDVVEADHSGRIAAAAVVSIAMYGLLLLVTMQVANGVAIEKSNRVSEVLLAIITPRTMLIGKVIAVGFTAMLPLVAAALPVAVRLLTSDSLPPGTGAAVAAATVWFVLGAGFYLLAAGALASLVERQEDVGSAVGLLTILLIGSYIVGQSAADSPIGAVLAYLPFSAPMVEPGRLALGVSSPVEVIGSLFVGVVSIMLMARFATLVYGRAVVRTGSKLRLSEVLRSPA